jgi:hypothetical protein
MATDSIRLAIDELQRDRGREDERHALELERIDDAIGALSRYHGKLVPATAAAPADGKKARRLARVARQYPTLKCPHCPRTFKGQTWLGIHVKKAHG